MNNKPLHATIKLEHSYSAPLERVFSEFADPVARARWSAPSNDVLIYDEADFRVGGKDVFSCGPKGDLKFRGETRYLHIVANARVVSSETVDVDGQRLLLLDCSRYALCRRRPDSCLLLLGGCDLVLLTTLYAVRLDRVSDRTHSAGVQNCRDWSVVSSRSADSVETRADQAGQLSGMAIYHQSAGANQVAILPVEPPSTQQSTRNGAHKNTPPSTSRWLDNTLRRRAGSRSAGPARTRSRLHAPEIRAAGPTNRVSERFRIRGRRYFCGHPSFHQPHVVRVERLQSSADQCRSGLDLHDLADHHVGGTSKAHTADGQVGVVDIKHAARLQVASYCWNTGGGPLTRFHFRLTFTSTRLAILMKGMLLFMP